MIRAHRPDLGQGRSQDEILELRRDAKGLTLLVARGLWRSCQQWRMPTPPSLWQPPTQRVEPSEKKSLRQIPSSNASPSLILGPGRTAKCVDFMVARHAGRCDRWIGSSVSRKLLQS